MPRHLAGGPQVHWLSSVFVYTLKYGFLLVLYRWVGWKCLSGSVGPCQADAVPGWPSRFGCDCFSPGRAGGAFGLHSGCAFKPSHEPVIRSGMAMVLDLLCVSGLVSLVFGCPVWTWGLLWKVPSVDGYSFNWFDLKLGVVGCR